MGKRQTRKTLQVAKAPSLGAAVKPLPITVCFPTQFTAAKSVRGSTDDARGGRSTESPSPPNPVARQQLTTPACAPAARCHSLYLWPWKPCGSLQDSGQQRWQRQPSWAAADPGAFSAGASCGPRGKETKPRRETGSGCSRHHATQKGRRSPERSPRKGRAVTAGRSRVGLQNHLVGAENGVPFSYQRGRKRAGTSGREPGSCWNTWRSSSSARA